MIFSAVLTTLWSLCRSATVQLKPPCVAVQQDALNGGRVEGYQQLLTHIVLLEHSQEMQAALLGLFDDSFGVCRPREVS